MRVLAVAFGLLSGLFLLAVPAPASAQGRSAAEVAGGGYSFVRDYTVKENYPAGWFASGACNVFDWLTAVAEISGTYKSYDFTVGSTNVSTNTRLHTFLGGARHSRRLKGVTAFGQVLAGVARETGGVKIFRQSLTGPQTKFTLQPGGGVDIPLTDRIGLRLAADYRRIFSDRENADQKNNNELRTAVGVVVGFGSR